MFTISVETQFKASHSVGLSKASPEPEHEHFWAVTVEVSTDKLESSGVAMDFALVKSKITEITSQLAGASLNEIDYFREKSPTAECVALYVFERLEQTLPKGVKLDSVTVSEQVGCSAKYSK
ncbi:MAG: 6-pyruvoyl tetrahydropterin synthase family protein [Sedimentisphaerales bacterium]|nr:6-pyruvoyl tetrahydropterin synthase family protein [Sedimentisphaerales bacterium]